MGSTTLTQMVNSVFARIDENVANDSAVTNQTRPEITRVVESLNAGYREVFNLLYGSLRPQVLDAISTIPGTPAYNVSALTNVLKTMYVYRVNCPGQLLPQSNIVDLTRDYGQLESMGEPCHWYRFNGTISFYPIPATVETFVVEGSINFTPLAVATDTTFLPEEHDYLLQSYALALEKAFWRDPDASAWMEKWTGDLQSLHAEALRNAPTKAYSVDPYATWEPHSSQSLRRYYT